ncbi:MAG: serine/threonine-protein kinase [Acidimicrobiales bacterium]
MSLDRDLVAAALTAYDLGGEIGRGGWGIVIGGRHRQLEREVAIKQLPRAFAADPAVRARFVAEARLLASLDHPHIVPVYDFVELDGVCLLVMEKLTGGTVWSRFTGAGLSMDTACAVVLATCSAMECAHLRGILHRDIKPENLLFTDSEVLKVADFGIAKVVGGGQTLATRAGEVLGTPAYMAPEQAQAKELTPSTDVYAAGVMLYELLSGVLPFPEDADALTTLYRHAFEPPAPILDVAPQVPPEIAAVVMRAIATDAADRFPSAEAFGVALAEAATAAWGPGWLGRGDTPVMGAGKIVAATERASGPVGGAPPTEAAAPAVPAPPTEAAAASGPRAVPTERPRGRPSVAARPLAASLDEIDVADLVPVNEVLKRPPSPLPLVLCALALLLIAFGLGTAGLGTPEREAGSGSALSVNGASVGDTSVELDLSEPLTVTGTAPAGSTPTPAPTVRVEFSAHGIPLGSGSAPSQPGDGGSFAATVDASGARYLVPGQVTARIELRDGDTVIDRRTFPVTSEQPGFLTVPGVAGVALVLFVFAYAESLLRSRRRGKKVVTAPVSMAVIGALGGVALAVLAWVLGADEPTVATVVACAVVGAGAGVVATVAAGRSARRRRPPRKA